MTNRDGSISRRAFLRDCGAVAVLSAAPLSMAQIAGATSREPLGRSRFAPLLGTTLTMSGAGERVDVVLAEINDLRPSARAGDEHRFSLVFRAPAGHVRSGGIRTFSHEALGEVTMFVAPIDRGVRSLRYEAVINR